MEKPSAAKRVPLRRRLYGRLRLSRTLILLPNLITLSAIYCGFDSIRTSAIAESNEDYLRAALLIIFAMFFDMLDGRVARMTKTQSAFGLQIDSIADVISFGAAPALLVYSWALSPFGFVGQAAAFAYVACAAIRLARFNVLSMSADGNPTKPSKYIVGLAAPGAAGILVSLVVAGTKAGGVLGGLQYTSAILVVTIVLGLLMVSNIEFRSFKDLRLNLRTVLLVSFAVGSSILIGSQLGREVVLLWLLGCYVALGIFETLWRLPRRIRERRSGRQADSG